jgi:uncharacterized protein YmfQ (DUF2313 family)
MFYAELTTDDFIGAVEALLPPGPSFPRDPGSLQTRFYSAIAFFFWQLHQDIIRFFDQETDPNRTQDMLPEWQAAYGITARGTEDEQRVQLAAVIADPGGFSGAHYLALATTLGITITVAATGAFTWTVHAPAALAAADRGALEALIDTHNRATCVVSFAYDL